MAQQLSSKGLYLPSFLQLPHTIFCWYWTRKQSQPSLEIAMLVILAWSQVLRLRICLGRPGFGLGTHWLQNDLPSLQFAQFDASSLTMAAARNPKVKECLDLTCDIDKNERPERIDRLNLFAIKCNHWKQRTFSQQSYQVHERQPVHAEDKCADGHEQCGTQFN